MKMNWNPIKQTKSWLHFTFIIRRLIDLNWSQDTVGLASVSEACQKFLLLDGDDSEGVRYNRQPLGLLFPVFKGF